MRGVWCCILIQKGCFLDNGAYESFYGSWKLKAILRHKLEQAECWQLRGISGKCVSWHNDRGGDVPLGEGELAVVGAAPHSFDAETFVRKTLASLVIRK